MAKKVFISAGHGGKDPGAVGNGLKEKDINLQIAMANGAELKRHGVSVVFSRTKDENDPVTQEVREANASGADLAISHHINSATSTKADGSETYYYTGDAKGKRLAELCEEATKALGQNSRGAKPTSSLWFIRGTKMLAVLTESCFINNPTDIKFADTVAEQQAIGKAYAKAILKYLGIEYKQTTEAATQKPVTVAYAKSFKKSLAGKYKVVSSDGVLNMRTNAGVKHDLVIAVPAGKVVQCYGYYTDTESGATWLLVQYGKYKGFMSKAYLKKL